jgi:hypothetical protein
MKLQAHGNSDMVHVKTQNGKFDNDFISGQLIYSILLEFLVPNAAKQRWFMIVFAIDSILPLQYQSVSSILVVSGIAQGISSI